MHRVLLAVSLFRGALAAYTCEGVEPVGEVQGETGSVCAPRCRDNTYECPSDVPSGVTAQPQCMLQDVNQVAYCGLLCSADLQCPSGASCKRVGAAGHEVGICIHPLSYKDWAHPTSMRTKLTVGWPAKANQNTKSFQLAKAFAALQSLKRRFGIADGDADVLTVKELLAAASSKVVAGNAGRTGMSTQSSQASTLGSAPQQPPSNPHAPRDLSEQAFMHDVNYFLNNMANGPAGIEKEIGDTVWHLEHLDQYGECTELLRGCILFALAYLGIGALYKNQTLGATGYDMIPHIGFWQEYPNLVMDGMNYAQALVSECLGGRPVTYSGNIGGQPGDRDTFANFEPSK